MKSSRVARKERLMEMAEAEIEKLLDWMEATNAPDLASIEKVVVQMRKRMGERLSAEVIDAQEAVRLVPGPECPKCKQEMHYKGMKRKEITSLSGEIELKRGYYYCDHCRNGLFPPRQATWGAGTELVGEHNPGHELAEWRIQ